MVKRLLNPPNYERVSENVFGNAVQRKKPSSGDFVARPMPMEMDYNQSFRRSHNAIEKSEQPNPLSNRKRREFPCDVAESVTSSSGNNVPATDDHSGCTSDRSKPDKIKHHRERRWQDYNGGHVYRVCNSIRDHRLQADSPKQVISHHQHRCCWTHFAYVTTVMCLPVTFETFANNATVPVQILLYRVWEIPYTLAAVLLSMPAFYPEVGFTGVEAFFTFYLILSLYVLFQEYLAEFVVFLSPNMEVAEILGMVVNLITFVFSGFSPPATQLPQRVKWIYYINPLTYAQAALSTVVFGDCSSDDNSIGCRQVANVPPSLPDGITVKEYLELNYGMKHDEIWRNCGIVFAFVILVRVLTILAMRFLNYQKT